MKAQYRFKYADAAPPVSIPSGTPVSDKRLWNKLIRNAESKVDPNLPHPMNANYDPLTDTAHVSKRDARNPQGFMGKLIWGDHEHIPREYLLAHELGHGKFHRTGYGRFAQSVPVLLGTGLASTLGTGIQQGFSDTENPGTRAALYSLLMQAPRLSAEVGASYLGHKLLKGHGASPEQLARYRRHMLGAFGTYGIGAARNAGVSALAAKGIRSVRDVASDRTKNEASPDSTKNAAYRFAR